VLNAWDCCTLTVGDPPRWLKQKQWLLNLWIAMHQALHNFQPAARGPNDEVIFSCGYLQSNGRCGIYRFRPFLCRHYPVLPFFKEPAVLPGCGYCVLPRVVSKMRAHPRLPILNPRVAVHHPSPVYLRHDSKTFKDLDEHFILVAPEGLEPLPTPLDSDPQEGT
jgi:hypothetical protein